MGTAKTSDEEMDEYIERLGEDLGKAFWFFLNDFSDLVLKWTLYRTLFGTNQERVNLFNSVSGFTAELLERTLFESVLLDLRCLSDPLGKDSISIDKIMNLLVVSEKRPFQSRASAAKKAVSFARDWANKRIAHSDWKYRTGQSKLEGASRASVEAALIAISEFINEFARMKLGTEFGFEIIRLIDGDEMAFLEALFDAHQARNASKGAGGQGAYPPWLVERYQPSWF